MSGIYNRNENDFTNKVPTQKKDRYRLCAKMLIFYVKQVIASARALQQQVYHCSGVRNRNFTAIVVKHTKKALLKSIEGIFNP